MYSRFQDMDLIEVLWKQDVDLGFTLVEPATAPTKKPSTSEKESADEIEKLKALEAINATYQKVRKSIYFLSFQLVYILRHYIYLSKTHARFRIVSGSQSQRLTSDCLSRMRRFLLSRMLEGSVCFLGLNLNVRFSICQRAH